MRCLRRIRCPGAARGLAGVIPPDAARAIASRSGSAGMQMTTLWARCHAATSASSDGVDHLDAFAAVLPRVAAQAVRGRDRPCGSTTRLRPLRARAARRPRVGRRPAADVGPCCSRAQQPSDQRAVGGAAQSDDIFTADFLRILQQALHPRSQRRRRFRIVAFVVAPGFLDLAQDFRLAGDLAFQAAGQSQHEAVRIHAAMTVRIRWSRIAPQSDAGWTGALPRAPRAGRSKYCTRTARGRCPL